MSDLNPSTRSKRSRITIAQRVLASLVAGAGLDEISAAERLTRKRTENILCEALRGRWIAPAEEFAHLQIARLERMIARLVDRLQKGDLRRSTAPRSSTGSTAITASQKASASPNIMAKRSAGGCSRRSTTSPPACSRKIPPNDRRSG